MIHFKDILRRIKAKSRNHLGSGFNPNELQKLFEETIEQELENHNISDVELESFSGRLAESIPNVCDDIATLLYTTLRKNARSMLKDRRRGLKAFEKRHYSLWKNGIDLLESFLVTAYELGENFNRYHRKAAAEDEDYLFDALTKLHARSVHVGFEVLCLLRSGFADGAHARWRTAHEIAVVSNFLAMHGNDVARKYLEHEIIESYRAMNQFQQYAETLGQEKISEDDIVRIESIRDDLCGKYGKQFGGRYGWAAEVLDNKKPKFSDIEKASELDYMRPYYKMASYNVHADSKGIGFRLGLSDGANILLAGPSNFGLADPAHGVAASVCQSTFPMLNLITNIDTIVMGGIMNKFVDDIGETFYSIQNSSEL